LYAICVFYVSRVLRGLQVQERIAAYCASYCGRRRSSRSARSTCCHYPEPTLPTSHSHRYAFYWPLL